MYGYPVRVSGPIRTGYFYGLAGVFVALASDLYFLFVDPADTRRRPGSDGGRRHGGYHTVPDDRFAGDVARRDRPRLRCGGGPEDRLLRKRGPYGDPAGTQRAWGLPREGQGSPATRAACGGRGDPATPRSAGPRPFDGQLRPARRPPRNGGRACRGAPRPSLSPGR